MSTFHSLPIPLMTGCAATHQLLEDEACMLREQRAEVEELYEARAARLESLVEEWKSKYGSLRRRFALETEGFRRDADEIGRYS